jgi:hypothetical protein|tara:strand:- start:376 stop:531 length:156 start_codon:yes stop_codon:yes gene_type:complete
MGNPTKNTNVNKYDKTDLIESYLMENYPHIYRTTTRRGIKKWVELNENEKK